LPYEKIVRRYRLIYTGLPRYTLRN